MRASTKRMIGSALGAAALACGAAGCRDLPTGRPIVAEAEQTLPPGRRSDPPIAPPATRSPSAKPSEEVPAEEQASAPLRNETTVPSGEPARALEGSSSGPPTIPSPVPIPPELEPTRPEDTRASRDDRRWGYGIVGGVGADAERAEAERAAAGASAPCACPADETPSDAAELETAEVESVELDTAEPETADRGDLGALRGDLGGPRVAPASGYPRAVGASAGGVAAGVTYDHGVFEHPPGARRTPTAATPAGPIDPGEFEHPPVAAPSSAPPREREPPR